MAGKGYIGRFGLTNANSPFNHHDFHIAQKLGRVRTGTLVKVVNVTQISDHQYTVDVQPLVNQVDALGNSEPHGVIYSIPMMNGSGANGSTIVQPANGDVGFMAVCDRDISSVLATGKAANPGSGRTHDFSDGVYMGGVGGLNTPSQYIVMTSAGIKIVGNLIVTGTITATGDITAGQGGVDQVDMQGHTHGGGPKPDPGT